MIHVFYGLHDKDGNYSRFTGTSILSLLENTNSDVTIHILHDNTLTQDNRDKFTTLAKNYSQKIEFHNVENMFKEKLEEIQKFIHVVVNSRFTLGALYRLFASNVLSGIDKAIYLDSDTIINLDIVEMWNYDLQGKSLGVIPNIDRWSYTDLYDRIGHSWLLLGGGGVNIEDYFNSGVLLMNLEKLRSETESLYAGIKFCALHAPNVQGLADQTILNYCYSKDTVKLPVKFNNNPFALRKDGKSNIEKGIYHYVNSSANLNLDTRDNFNWLWVKYFLKSPWGDNTRKIIGNLYNMMKSFIIDRQNFSLKISAAISGKDRAFFCSEKELDAAKKIFAIKSDEEVILSDADDSTKKLIESLKKSCGKKIFLILTENWREVQTALREEKFELEKDFLVLTKSFLEAQGILPNAFQLLKNL